MKVFGAITTLLAALALASCAHAPRQVAQCQGAKCTVTIQVDASCAVTAQPDPLHVARDSKNGVIRWEIATPGYSLDATRGVYIKQDVDKQVAELHPVGKDWQAVNHNNKAGGSRFSYGIVVVDGNGKACPALDPVVINDDY